MAVSLVFATPPASTITVSTAGETTTVGYDAPRILRPSWGAYNGMNGSWDVGDNEYAAIVGSYPMTAISYYSMVDGELPGAQDGRRFAAGTVPQISLESKGYKTKNPDGTPVVWAWKDIASGLYDAKYIAFAKKLAAFNAPVLVCPDHEGDEAIVNKKHLNETGADYVRAFLHVQEVMAPWAPKIIWVWWTGGSNASVVQSCYPGDNHVDIVGCDPYKWPWHKASDGPAQTWGNRYANLNPVVGASVPRAITETATDIRAFGVPAAVDWWSKVADTADSMGLVYVNFYNRHSDGDWWIDPYPDVIAEVKRQIAKMPGPLSI